MKYTIEISSKFKKDYKLIKKRGYDINLLKEVIDLLADGQQLPEKILRSFIKRQFYRVKRVSYFA